MYLVLFIIILLIAIILSLVSRNAKIPVIGSGEIKQCQIKRIEYSDGITRILNTIDNDIITKDTKFKVGSTTKVFTVNCLQIMEYKGLVDLNKPVKNYMSVNVKGLPDDVTVMDFINHESGMIRMPKKVPTLTTTSATGALKSFANDKELFKPSKEHVYSNIGYILLGHVIENVTNLPYYEAFDKYIFKPSEISPTINPVIKMYNHKHFVDAKLLTKKQKVDENFATSGGSLCCSINDLIGFSKKLNHNSFPKNFYAIKGNTLNHNGLIYGGICKFRVDLKTKFTELQLGAITGIEN